MPYSPAGIASFVNLLKPRQRKDAKGNPKGDPKYSVALFFSAKTDISEMIELAEAKAEEAFGPKWEQLKDKGKINWPFQDTDDMEEAKAPFDKPGVKVDFKKGIDNPPGIVDADGEPITSNAEVYSGMRARVSYRCFSYDNESKGVSFALINVQKLGDGTRLSGDPDAESDFAKAPAVKGEKSSAKPMGKRRADPDEDDDEDTPPPKKRKSADKYGGLL